MREISRGAAIISEEEQFEQRARMELELAQQRQQLPPEHTVATVGMPVEEELAVIEEKVGLPISDIQTGAASPTGAIVAERAIDVETPAAARRAKCRHATERRRSDTRRALVVRGTRSAGRPGDSAPGCARRRIAAGRVSVRMAATPLSRWPKR